MDNCDKGNHNIPILSVFLSEDEYKVVRWCRNCGAIVVDLDYDGRINPGYFMKMILPSKSKKTK